MLIVDTFFFGDAGIKSDWNWRNIGSTDLLYGGIQNGIISVEQINVMVHNTSNAGVHKGFVADKLVNDNIVLTYRNENNIELFPNLKQAESRGLVGLNQVYKEILRNYKIPFIKEASGYYFFDSNEYHLKKNQNYGFDLHVGKAGGISEWNELEKGFFPFNRDCFIGESSEMNELYYGMRLDIPFYMNNSGKMLNYETNELEDIIFDFRGDDDVWIFVDDKLCLDLGRRTYGNVSDILIFPKINHIPIVL